MAQNEKLNTPNNIKIMYQPPYSPEVNPTELIWDYIREKYFANKIMESIKYVEKILVTALRELRKNKEKIHSLVNFSWISQIV